MSFRSLSLLAGGAGVGNESAKSCTLVNDPLRKVFNRRRNQRDVGRFGITQVPADMVEIDYFGIGCMGRDLSPGGWS
jgi:hypothetical protein